MNWRKSLSLGQVFALDTPANKVDRTPWNTGNSGSTQEGDYPIVKSELLATKTKQIQTETPDILIVGSGLTGSIMAHELNRLRYSVLVVESRNWVGCKILEAFHDSRIRYGVYGPHFFRTGSKRIWD